MNSAHLHLVITHLPVLGSLFGLCLLVLALMQRNVQLERTSLWVFVAAAMAAVPTYLSGTPASALLMKRMPGMSMDAGDQHAEVAVVALVAVSVLGLLALFGLVFYRQPKQPPGRFRFAAVIMALVTAALMGWTANLGGNIRHTEIHDPSSVSETR